MTPLSYTLYDFPYAQSHIDIECPNIGEPIKKKTDIILGHVPFSTSLFCFNNQCSFKLSDFVLNYLRKDVLFTNHVWYEKQR